MRLVLAVLLWSLQHAHAVTQGRSVAPSLRAEGSSPELERVELQNGALSPVAAYKTTAKAVVNIVTATQAPSVQAVSRSAAADSRWSKQHKKPADVEDMDYFWGVPKLAWIMMCDGVACILFVVGVRAVTALARKRSESDYEVPLQAAA
mmetsp:Transcript_54673/g.97549  ORF Transcript_54673/g.97549 Transcript_54673/m.97549 type:complete len:149 (+) Transcript_54673:138-584(+)|eukprot:CAMPEP_0197653852 /NCGR_PEP_ID=MMETSP1338-20131121/37396_1 /TAXON_ID=43686 ORGANISM="Pelagodinium beii, Strain RCC1491" /NCGR_SAMPLE_ID=MMETSP1338 /ASSEMBLY_ACC=CAM_ASM_000754 /LENGTH=148 /DNA_ID=CAMNT_0043229113 /DNA_START=103 /DNA_END=549 /DNA_ORIENTATION=-